MKRRSFFETDFFGSLATCFRCLSRMLFGLCVMCLALPMIAAADLVEGRDFRVLNPPLPVDSGDRIEVVEFFWYGCEHCADFDPVVSAWAKKLPADVAFRRIPAVMPNNKWVPAARLFLTLDAMNQLERLHGEVFRAIHVDRLRLDEQRTLMTWVGSKGIDARLFAETWNSFGTATKVQRVKEITYKAGLKGVPALVVHGRYLAISEGSYGDLLKVTDQLVARTRAERRGGS